AELVTQSSGELERQVRDLSLRMRSSMGSIYREKFDQWKTLDESYAFKQPRVLIQQYSQRLDELFRQLQNYSKSLVEGKSRDFQTLAGRLHALSPLAILERGYSISFSQ